MWLSTVQLFKILRSVKASFEYKSKKKEKKRKEIKRKYGKRHSGKRKKDKGKKKHFSNLEAVNRVKSNPKEPVTFLCFQQSSFQINKDLNLKSTS